MAKPVFSVIIPTYNRQKLIGRAIKSVIAQTFQSFEILVIDDASTDCTENVVRDLNDERIIYIRSERNRGAAYSRNRGIEIAKGDYISFLDSDDYYLPDFLSLSVREFSAASSDVGFIWTGYRVVNNEDKELYNFIWKPARDSGGYYQFLKGLRIGTGCGLTFRRESLTNIQFNNRLRAAEDTEFLLRFARSFSYSYVDKILIVINKHEGDRITRNVRETLISYLEILRVHKEVILEHADLRLKYLGKIMTLAYKTGKVRFARRIFSSLLPLTFRKPELFLRFLFFEWRTR